MKGIVFLALFFFAQISFAKIWIQNISGADSQWTVYMESHLTFCNQRGSDSLLRITFKSSVSGEAKLVTHINKVLWQKPKISKGTWTTLEIPWGQICSSMGNRYCRNSQHSQFKLGVDTNGDSLLEDYQVLYVQILDRCS